MKLLHFSMMSWGCGGTTPKAHDDRHEFEIWFPKSCMLCKEAAIGRISGTALFNWFPAWKCFYHWSPSRITKLSNESKHLVEKWFVWHTFRRSPDPFRNSSRMHLQIQICQNMSVLIIRLGFQSQDCARGGAVKNTQIFAVVHARCCSDKFYFIPVRHILVQV